MRINDSAELAGYTGYIFSVQATIYNDANPEYENGIFREWVFDDEFNGQVLFDEQSMLADWYQERIDEEPNPDFNAISLFLTIRHFKEGEDESKGKPYIESVHKERKFVRRAA